MSRATRIPSEIAPLRPLVAAELRRIEPSNSGFGLPCQATTVDGRVYPRVYVVEANAYIWAWGVWPRLEPGESWLPAEEILALEDSPWRLPARFANELYAAGESGMGYCAFSVEFRDGQRQYYVTGNAVDFLDWPAGYGPAQVVRVRPHDREPNHPGATRSHRSNAKSVWTPYRRQRWWQRFVPT